MENNAFFTKGVSIILAVTMIVPNTVLNIHAEETVSYALETIDEEVNVVEVSNETELRAAFKNGGYIKLKNDIELSSILDIGTSGTPKEYITLDLNEYTIKAGANFGGETAELVKVRTNATIMNGKFEASSVIKHTLDVIAGAKVTIRDVVIDHSSCGNIDSTSTALVVNASEAILEGNVKFITGTNSAHAIDVDHIASLTFTEGMTFSFEGPEKSVKLNNRNENKIYLPNGYILEGTFIITYKEKLENLVQKAESKIKEDYTTDSWEKLSQALTSANNILNNNQSTNDDFNTAYENLDTAIKELVKNGVGEAKSELQALIDEIESSNLNQENYTLESWQNLQEQLEKAKNLLLDSVAAPVLINFQYKSLLNAKTNLVVSMAGLNNLIADAEELLQNSNNYTPESIAELQNSVDEAKKLIDTEATSEEIEIAFNALNEAIHNLDEMPSIDITILESTINEAKAISKGNYTDLSWNSLLAAITSAEEVLAAPTSQETVNSAIDALRNAIDGLVVEKPVTPPSYNGGGSVSSKPIVEGTEIKSGDKVDVDEVRTNKEVKETLGKENILTTVEVQEETEEPVEVMVKVGKDYKEETVYVVQQNLETGNLELVATTTVDKKGYATFVTESSEALTLTTALPNGFIDTVATTEEPSVTYYVENNEFVYGWKKLTDGWHFFDYTTGIHQTGKWIADGHDANDNVRWFVLKENGVMKANEWHCSTKDIWYYVGDNGEMVRDTYIEQYYVDANGQWHR